MSREKMFFLFLIIAIVVAALVFVRSAGQWLVTPDQIAQADLLVVMMGPVPDRALQAKTLYEQGLAHQIVFTNEYQPGAEQLKTLGIELQTTAEVFRSALLKLGIPDSSITILPVYSTSTSDEAVNIGRYLTEHPQYKKVIVVTSSYHTKRTGLIFNKLKKILPNAVSFTISPNPFTDYNGKKWWSDRISFKLTILEYIKLINYFLSEQFQMAKQMKNHESFNRQH